MSNSIFKGSCCHFKGTAPVVEKHAVLYIYIHLCVWRCGRKAHSALTRRFSSQMPCVTPSVLLLLSTLSLRLQLLSCIQAMSAHLLPCFQTTSAHLLLHQATSTCLLPWFQATSTCLVLWFQATSACFFAFSHASSLQAFSSSRASSLRVPTSSHDGCSTSHVSRPQALISS